MKTLKKQPKPIVRRDVSSDNPLNFISAGVGCNCLVTLHHAGILDRFSDGEALSAKEISAYENPMCIESALVTLKGCGIIEKNDNKFRITEFGIETIKYIGLITMVFDGYGGLISKQREIVSKKILHPETLIRGSVVSRSAIQLAKKMFDSVLIKEFSKLKFSGTICDLGCGYGEMLSTICGVTGSTGLGFDSEPSVVEEAKIRLKGTNIFVEQMDITNLQGVWEDVSILIQCHVFHDVTSQEDCIRLMNSFLDNFPRLKYFFFLDSVAPCDSTDEILPGFDYVHGLLGKKMRNYEETIAMFNKSKFFLSKKIQINGVPNTFLWILIPNRLG